MNNTDSLFITIEGIEGAGKSTNAQIVVEHLTKLLGSKVVHTREPGGTIIAEKIRAILLDQTFKESFTKEAELLLLFAARSQHVEHLILPELLSGNSVVCERFTDASFAYQGGGRGIDKQVIAFLENFVQHELRPDLVFIFDVDVKLGLERVRSRGNNFDRIEQEQVDFFVRVKQVYLELASKNPDRYFVINADQPIHLVQQQIITVLNTFLHAKQLV